MLLAKRVAKLEFTFNLLKLIFVVAELLELCCLVFIAVGCRRIKDFQNNRTVHI